MSHAKNSSFLSQMGPLLFLVGIFFLNFLSRIILSPLMPTVEGDLKIGHDEAGALFLLISLGYCLGLLSSGFVSSRIQHRRTILLSSIAVGGALMVVSISHNLWGIRFGLILVGMAAGLYLPSGIATVTELVRPEHWGKAIAIHELAPNLSFFLAPLLAEALLGLSSWREVLMLTGIASMAAGGVFAFFGKGGALPGETPNLGTLRTILGERSFWIMISLFSLGIGASFGVYTMMPLYLVVEKGMDRPWANTLVGLSRASTLGFSILSGWVTDRIGPKKTLWGVFMTTGIATILLGLVSGSWIILPVFAQPILATAFFPPGFAALSRVGSKKIKSVAVSLTMPVGFLVGGGVIAAGIGIMGKMGSFSLGISLFGVLLFLGVLLVRYLKFSNE
jgi:NNP family nitrate/nitrite transporter-like MFS transporter